MVNSYQDTLIMKIMNSNHIEKMSGEIPVNVIGNALDIGT